MNFNLSEEQTMIRDSIARFVQENYEFDQRNKVVAMEHDLADRLAHGRTAGFPGENVRDFARSQPRRQEGGLRGLTNAVAALQYNEAPHMA